VIKTVFGHAVISLVPVIISASDIVMHSVLVGTANAYATLRVDIICQSYCRSITAVDRRKARRNASIAAASMLGSIVSGSAGSVIRAIAAAATSIRGRVSGCRYSRGWCKVESVQASA
jgi:uncharacterized SAM-dependent methyltransferase